MNRRTERDRGSTAIELPLAVGLLLIPVACLVLALPRWPESQTVATAAAKEAATLYATASTSEEGAALAQAAVERAAANSGRPLTLQLSGDWCRGCSLTANVTVDVPSIIVPGIGSTGNFSWTATSTARRDDYQSIGGDA